MNKIGKFRVIAIVALLALFGMVAYSFLNNESESDNFGVVQFSPNSCDGEVASGIKDAVAAACSKYSGDSKGAGSTYSSARGTAVKNLQKVASSACGSGGFFRFRGTQECYFGSTKAEGCNAYAKREGECRDGSLITVFSPVQIPKCGECLLA